MAQKAQLEQGLILDSSVVIKWFSIEEDTDKALLLRENYINGKCVLADPDLLLYEIANALRYNKAVTKEDVTAAIDSIFALDIDVVVPTKEVIEEAISLAFQYDITVYDAYFVALAKVLQFTFITADERLHNKLKELSFVTLLKNYMFENNSEKGEDNNGE
jgi:predicted nucleic acid-binding protein